MKSNRSRHSTSPGYSATNRVRLIRGGKDYFDLIVQLISNAKESIHLQTYIFGDDSTGSLVAEALKAAARRKVQVYLLADGYASQELSKNSIAELKASGVHFRFFEPFFKSRNYYFGRRMHHKIFVADTRHALVGGVNIADRYNDLPGDPAWLDFALYAEGDIAKELCILCWKTWKSYPRRMGTTPCEKKPLQFDIKDNERKLVRMRRNDWLRRRSEISGTYIEMFRHAHSSVTILCSYFLPGKVIRRLLKSAAKRGVRIRVVTAGPSDVKIAKYAERWMYDWLLRKGIELYEYQPTVLHAKIAVCDAAWLTVGSYNINNISAYASIELNLDVKDAALALQTEEELEAIIRNDCLAITSKEHSRRTDVIKQFVRWCSYEIIRLIFYLVTFYYKRKE